MTESESTENEDQPTAPPEEPRRRPLVMPILLLLVVALAATSGYLGWQLRDTDQDLDRARATARAGDDAAEAAREFAILVATYSPATLDDDFENVLAHTTGRFRDEYEDASSKLRKSILKLEGRSTGKVHAVGVVSADEDKAEVVVFLDQIVRNAGVEESRTDRTRMRLELVHEDGEWLVSELKLV